jgi:hypothetical protein
MEFILWFVITVFTCSLTLAGLLMPWALWAWIIRDIYDQTYWPGFIYVIGGIFTACIPLAFNLLVIANLMTSQIAPVIFNGPFHMVETMRQQTEEKLKNERAAQKATSCHE